MKQSDYNFFYELENGDCLAFNSLRNGLAVVDKDTAKMIESHPAGTTPDFDDESLKELKRGGFLCEDDFNEFGLLTIRRHTQQYNTSSLGLTIAPTLSCNLACRYCFENPSPEIMEETVMEALVKYVKRRLEAGIDEFSAGWYGGEPLLVLDVIEKLSHRFMEACEEKKVRYSASIVTNGTLLTPEVVERLKKIKVTNAQVTLDGEKDTHDQMRPFKARSAGSSYEKIIANLKAIAGTFPISLRINLDATNKDQAMDFVDRLNKEEWFREHMHKPNGIRPYYGHVKIVTAACKCGKDEILKASDFWNKDLQLKKYLYEKLDDFSHYPEQTYGGCIATTIDNYVVDPRGNLTKCWNHLGVEEKTVGTVFEPFEMAPLAVNYLTESFENDPECLDCKVLPICMGGCVDMRAGIKTGEHDEKDCANWKYYLEETLRKFYLSKVNGNGNGNGNGKKAG